MRMLERQRERPIRAVASTLFALACCIATSASANDVAPIHVTVNGVSIKIIDFGSLTKAALEAHSKNVLKDPEAMPSDAPLIYYAGDRTIWQSRKLNQDLGGWARVTPAEQLAEDSFDAALALLAMDVGTAGEPRESLYRNTPTDRASRLALGKAVAEALKERKWSKRGVRVWPSCVDAVSHRRGDYAYRRLRYAQILRPYRL